MSTRKRFDKDLYEKYDQLAKEATTNLLTNLGYSVEDHPARYAQDLVVYSTAGDIAYLAECEVKLVWKGDTFPYDSVQLPQRKSKFFEDLTRFFIWNNELTQAMTFYSSEIAMLDPVEVPNKYVHSGEYFYQIPLELVEQVSA